MKSYNNTIRSNSSKSAIGKILWSQKLIEIRDRNDIVINETIIRETK